MRVIIGNRLGVTSLVLILCLLGGCAESHEQRAQRLEPMLSEAGFRTVSADTPARVEKLNQMKPLKISYFSRNGKPVYWFPDPYVCHCLYRGNQKNYEKYQELKSQASSEQEEAEAADDQASQQAFMEFMASPASQVFYGE